MKWTRIVVYGNFIHGGLIIKKRYNLYGTQDLEGAQEDI